MTNMANFDFKKVARVKNRPVDPDWSNPVSFFYKLSHPTIRDLYPIQSNILQAWYAEFKKGVNDKIVSLNTGGGKTLIGLMVAESIRRDVAGKVLYICSNNLLGKQTLDENRKYGIKAATYLNIAGSNEGPDWDNKNLFLENNALCITNYHAVFNPRSIFRQYEIRGIVFDDAHLALGLLDEQFTLKVENPVLMKKITDIFKSSPAIREKIASIQDNDPLPLIMIPPLEWHRQAASIKDLLVSDDKIRDSLPWLNLKEKIDKTFCFATAKSIEISLLYPDISDHYAFHKDVHRIYLSATLPNLDDLTRVFGVTPSRIETNNPDYRPQRLFVFSTKLNRIKKAEDAIRSNLNNISPKTFVLVPSRDSLEPYKLLGASTAATSAEVVPKLDDFKSASSGILALANRYDGIDLPGGTCHCLLLDGLPYTGTLKTRFFSEYFQNHKNSFLRSIIASKLIQAFGRTIRSNDDYSIIFLLGDKLNSWVINRDNRKFFKTDLSEDIEIGSGISGNITGIDELITLAREILNQTSNWREFYETEKDNVGIPEALSEEDEHKNIMLAQKERNINGLLLAGDYKHCLEKTLEAAVEFGEYSKPILGLYLSIAAICCLETNDNRLPELSARAYGINPIFGMPVTLDNKQRSLQAQRLIDFNKALPTFNWLLKERALDENLRQLGEVLGFSTRRPEAEGDGTLDVCWEDEEKKVVIGFENKTSKTNKTLSKHEIDQCSGHYSWLQQSYPDYKRILFVVGDIENYSSLGSPLNLCHLKITEFEKVSREIPLILGKRIYPDQIDPFLESRKLRIDKIFAQKKVIALPKIIM